MAEQSVPPPPRRHHRRHGPSDHQTGQPPVRIELSDEEKAVLVECRRSSLARGIPLGIGSAVLLRWLVIQGRVPMHVQRWAGVYYGGAFFAGLFMGVSSYKQRCFDKIMSLEHSALKDQVREHMARQKGHESWDHGRPSPGSVPPPSQGLHQTYPSRRASPTTPPSTNQEGLIPPHSRGETHRDSHSDRYEPGSSEQPLTDSQPEAFGLVSPQSPVHDSQEDTGTQSRRRTFDEIREENRRRQLQQNFPSVGRGERAWPEGDNSERKPQERSQRSGRGQGAAKPVRTNKYGDIIED